MCGFVGLYKSSYNDLSERQLSSVLKNMTKTIEHRGPDNQGIYINSEENLGLGFQRLSILDLKKLANQPMMSRNKDWIMVYNGEVYNYKKLKRDLNKDKSFWKTSSDTEVILENISQFGFFNTIKKLNGMFAVAAFCLSKKTLWLARDKFGEKPLENYSDNHGLCFASDLRAISSSPEFNKEIDENSFTQFLRYGYVPEPLIFIKTLINWSGYIIKFNNKNLIKKKILG